MRDLNPGEGAADARMCACTVAPSLVALGAALRESGYRVTSGCRCGARAPGHGDGTAIDVASRERVYNLETAIGLTRRYAATGFAVIAEGDHFHIEEVAPHSPSIAGSYNDGELVLTDRAPPQWLPYITETTQENPDMSSNPRYRTYATREAGDPLAREEAKVADGVIANDDDKPVAIRFWHTNRGVNVAANIQRYLSVSEARAYATALSINGPRCFPKPIPFTWVPPAGPVPGFFMLQPAWAASAANPEGPLTPGVPPGESWESLLAQITIAPKALESRLSNPVTVALELDANHTLQAVLKTPGNLAALDVSALFAEVIADMTVPFPVQITSAAMLPLPTDFPRFTVTGVSFPDYNVFWEPESKASLRTRELVALLRGVS